MNYSTQLVVSVVGNAPKSVEAYLTTMQAMTSTICSSIPEGLEGQLEDTRDGQKYYVGKMKDGKCWMLQNLALGSTSGETTLTPADSNVTSDWNLPTAYTTSKSGDSSDLTAIQLWNLGKVALATPLLTTGCGTSGVSSLANCTKVGFVDVSSNSFQPTYKAAVRNWLGANANSSTLVTVNCTAWSGSGTSKICTAGAYDAHYLVGNYYSWNAVTAGTGGSITSGQAKGSICPKGWKLSTSNTTAVGSFSGLLSKYGVDSSVDSGTYNIAGEPLRFVRGGLVAPGDGVGNAGRNGLYWSSTPGSSNSSAYDLWFDDSSVKPSNSAPRQFGLSVRCVAE